MNDLVDELERSTQIEDTIGYKLFGIILHLVLGTGFLFLGAHVAHQIYKHCMVPQYDWPLLPYWAVFWFMMPSQVVYTFNKIVDILKGKRPQ